MIIMFHLCKLISKFKYSNSNPYEYIFTDLTTLDIIILCKFSYSV